MTRADYPAFISQFIIGIFGNSINLDIIDRDITKRQYLVALP